MDQPCGADRGKKGLINSAAEIRWSCAQHPDTVVNSYHHKLLTSSLLTSMCLSPLVHREIFVFFLCVCRKLEASLTPPNSPAGEPLLCSHILLTFYRLFTTGTRLRKFTETAMALTWTFCAHMHLLQEDVEFSACLKADTQYVLVQVTLLLTQD